MSVELTPYKGKIDPKVADVSDVTIAIVDFKTNVEQLEIARAIYTSDFVAGESDTPRTMIWAVLNDEVADFGMSRGQTQLYREYRHFLKSDLASLNKRGINADVRTMLVRPNRLAALEARLKKDSIPYSAVSFG